MASLLAEVVLPHKSGIPSDNVVNTFAFTTPSVGIVDTEVDAVTDSLVTFYSTAPAGGDSIASMIGNQISRTALVNINVYDLTGHLDGSPHGSPILIQSFALPAHVGAGPDLPAEIAVCLSFRAEYATDVEFAPGARPRARDRGRIYLGPLGTGMLTQDGTTGRVFVNATQRISMRDKMRELRDAAGHAWSVWSRKNAILEPVSAVWVDDAFDIQRRRGEKAVARTLG